MSLCPCLRIVRVFSVRETVLNVICTPAARELESPFLVLDSVEVSQTRRLQCCGHHVELVHLTYEFAEVVQGLLLSMPVSLVVTAIILSIVCPL